MVAPRVSQLGTEATALHSNGSVVTTVTWGCPAYQRAARLRHQARVAAARRSSRWR